MIFLKTSFTKSLLRLFSFLFALLCVSCIDHEEQDPQPVDASAISSTESIEAGLSFAESELQLLHTIEGKYLNKFASDSNVDTSTKLNVYKLSTSMEGLGGSTASIPLSGVLILPIRDATNSPSEPYRILYTPPFTYTLNASAPSVYFSNPHDYAGPIKNIEKFRFFGRKDS